MTIFLLQPDGVALSAGAHRRGRAALNGGGAGRAVGGRSGFRVDTPSDVLTVSTTAWSLKACSAMIDPGASVNQGMYGWASDAVITGTPTPPDATLPRKDIYYIQVNDSSAGDGTSGTPNADVYYLAGTPAASPVAPALPARSFLIGTVTVPQAGAGSPVVVLNPARFVASGGVLPVSSQGEQDALTKYQASEVVRTDQKFRRYISDGTKWMPPADAQGVQAHTAITASSGFVSALTVVYNIASFDFKAGRKYRIGWEFEYQGNTAGNYLTALIGTCSTADSAVSTTGITQRNGRPWKVHDAGVDSSGFVNAIFIPASDATLQVKFLIQITTPSTGGGTARITGKLLEPVLYTIEDLGAQY